MKYTKKQVTIEAFKWTADMYQTEDPIWIVEAIKNNQVIIVRESITDQVSMHIKTLEGTMKASIGDYIIQGVKGEIYPCKPDIFELTYTADAFGYTGDEELEQLQVMGVIADKTLRVNLDDQLQNLKRCPPSRERSIAITKLQEAIMWIGMDLKRLNEKNPYPNSYDPSNTIIEPTADNLKL